ncbi:MAG: EcsC family protein [Actinomycetota bacterium]|nr:EcsC family protein [Actinomycetota bacterium]
MSIAKRLGASLAPNLTKLAPGMSATFVHETLDRAINGAGPLPGAAAAGQKQLQEHHGDIDRAIHDVIENHVRYAGAQGFLTNIGGLVTMAVTVPANVTGLAVVQCRMVAAIAHLRGYDLTDPRTRSAIYAFLLGEDQMLSLISRKKLPGPPMALATAPVHDPQLDTVLANEVASELIAKVAGKRMASAVSRRVPLVGGLVGAGADGFSTWRIGRHVERELLPRNRR